MTYASARMCTDITKVENYDIAKADNFEGWSLHHRFKTHFSDGTLRGCRLTEDELDALGMLYERPPEEFIIMRTGTLKRLGTQTSKEARKRMSDAHKGVPLSKKHKESLSKSGKGKKRSEETKRRISNARKRYWKLKEDQGNE